MPIRVIEQCVPDGIREDVLRLIHLRLRWQGVSAEHLAMWGQHPFPDLREHLHIQLVREMVTTVLGLESFEACTPQIVWHLPDEAHISLEPHTDVPPDGRAFRMIAGVALTPWSPHNGGLHVWNGNGLPAAIELWPGDIVAMTPDTLHSPGLNHSGLPRIGLYFRWLEPRT